MKKLLFIISCILLLGLFTSCSTKKKAFSHEESMLEYKKREAVVYHEVDTVHKDSVSKELLDIEIERLIYYPEVFFDSTAKVTKQKIKAIEKITLKRQKKDSVEVSQSSKIDSTCNKTDTVSVAKKEISYTKTKFSNNIVYLWLILIIVIIIIIYMKLWRK